MEPVDPAQKQIFRLEPNIIKNEVKITSASLKSGAILSISTFLRQLTISRVSFVGQFNFDENNRACSFGLDTKAQWANAVPDIVMALWNNPQIQSYLS